MLVKKKISEFISFYELTRKIFDYNEIFFYFTLLSQSGLKLYKCFKNKHYCGHIDNIL